MDRDTYLLHQVHAAKLGPDGSADVVSTWLMWQRRVPAAVLAGFLPAGIGSTIVSLVTSLVGAIPAAVATSLRTGHPRPRLYVLLASLWHGAPPTVTGHGESLRDTC